MAALLVGAGDSWVSPWLRDSGRLPHDNHPTPRELRRLSRKGAKGFKLGPAPKTRQQVKRHQ